MFFAGKPSDELLKGVKIIEKQQRVCTRGRGSAGWAPGDRFRYTDGGPDDDGITITVFTAVVRGHTFSWSDID